MSLHTRACALFDVAYPIVQTGMGWVAGARLASATSEAGGLGVLAAATMTFEELQAQVAEVRSRTSKPFGVNLRADAADLDDRIAFLIEQQVKVVSFAGVPSKKGMKRLKDAGILTMPKVGARRHAEKMLAWGADVIIAQGGEGGGHTGSVPTTCLLPAVVDAVGDQIPVLGAGGFSDGRGLVAAMAYGADGIAMGTRFLLTQESTVPDSIKQIYLETGSAGTVRTTAIDGYPQRVIRTGFIDRLEKSSFFGQIIAAIRHALALKAVTNTSLPALVQEGAAMRAAQGLSWPQVMMAANAPMYTKATMVDGRAEAGILPTGSVVGRIDALPPVAALLDEIMRDAEAALARLRGGEP